MSVLAIPKLIQRKRTKGFRLPANTLYIGRPSKWANWHNWQDYREYFTTDVYAREHAAQLFHFDLYRLAHGYEAGIDHAEKGLWIVENILTLAEYDYVACWCPVSNDVWEHGTTPIPSCHWTVEADLLAERLKEVENG